MLDDSGLKNRCLRVQWLVVDTLDVQKAFSPELDITLRKLLYLAGAVAFQYFSVCMESDA